MDRSISGDGGVRDLLISRAWRRLIASAALLRLNQIEISFDAGCHTSDALLELAVLGGVDERVDTAVDGLQYKGEVVEPASEVDRVAEKVHKERDFNRCPTDDESAADHQ